MKFFFKPLIKVIPPLGKSFLNIIAYHFFDWSASKGGLKRKAFYAEHPDSIKNLFRKSITFFLDIVKPYPPEDFTYF